MNKKEKECFWYEILVFLLFFIILFIIILSNNKTDFRNTCLSNYWKYIIDNTKETQEYYCIYDKKTFYFKETLEKYIYYDNIK